MSMEQDEVTEPWDGRSRGWGREFWAMAKRLQSEAMLVGVATVAGKKRAEALVQQTQPGRSTPGVGPMT